MHTRHTIQELRAVAVLCADKSVRLGLLDPAYCHPDPPTFIPFYDQLQ